MKSCNISLLKTNKSTQSLTPILSSQIVIKYRLCRNFITTYLSQKFENCHANFSLLFVVIKLWQSLVLSQLKVRCSSYLAYLNYVDIANLHLRGVYV